MRAAAVVAGLSLVWVVVFGVLIAVHVGPPMMRSLTSPAWQTPVDRTMTLEHREYAVFELTGHQSGGGGVTFWERRAPSLEPGDVVVTATGGLPVPIHPRGRVVETLNRDGDLYTAAVYFTAPAPGSYRVVIPTGSHLQVVVAPSMGSGFAGIGPIVLAAAGGLLVLVISLILLAVALLRRRARPAVRLAPGGAWQAGGGVTAGTTTGTVGRTNAGRAVEVVSAPPPGPLPPPGWYPDPQVPGGWRFWDGRQWAAPPGGPPHSASPDPGRASSPGRPGDG